MNDEKNTRERLKSLFDLLVMPMIVWIEDALFPAVAYVLNPRHKEFYVLLIVLFVLWRVGVL